MRVLMFSALALFPPIFHCLQQRVAITVLGKTASGVRLLQVIVAACLLSVLQLLYVPAVSYVTEGV